MSDLGAVAGQAGSADSAAGTPDPREKLSRDGFAAVAVDAEAGGRHDTGPAARPLRRAVARLLHRLRRIAALRDILMRPVAADDVAPSPRRLLRRLSRPTRRRALQRLRRIPCFRPADYLADHPDVRAGALDPARHALFAGVFEGRQLFRPAALARCLGVARDQPAAAAAVTMPRPATRIGIYVSSRGNVFMRDIAEDLAASLHAAGVAVAVRDETAPICDGPELRLFVAPHEFFLLGRGPAWVRDDVIASGLMLNTEQPQTAWFARALPFLLAARGVVDLSAQTAGLLGRAGVPSLHLTPSPHLEACQLGPADRLHPLFRVLPKAAKSTPSPRTPFAARPLDLAFFATESPHRDAWLARNAAVLAERNCFIYYRRLARGPIRGEGAEAALTRLAHHVCGHARIVLNLHRDAFGFLEWHRVVRLGIASGALVVSEPSLPHPLLRPGEHFLEESAQLLPNLLQWLLHSEDGQRHAERVRDNAASLLAERLTPRHTAMQFLGFLERTAC